MLFGNKSSAVDWLLSLPALLPLPSLLPLPFPQAARLKVMAEASASANTLFKLFFFIFSSLLNEMVDL